MQCIGRTKPYIKLNRCKNQCRFFFCHLHYLQPIISIISIIGLVASLLQIFDWIAREEETNSQKIESIIDEKFNEYTIPDLNSNDTLPGFTMFLALELDPQPLGRRKYFFDLAESDNKNRISLFLDPENRLVFELIDKYGEYYSLRILQYEYQLYQPTIFCCEYGMSDEYSFIRLFVDGRFIDQHKYKFKIDLPIDIAKTMSLWSDINGENGVSMELLGQMIYSGTMGKKKRDMQFKDWSKMMNIPLYF
jgi:hypothetical protein